MLRRMTTVSSRKGGFKVSKWKPSKAKKDEYKKKMAQIESFCEKNRIHHSKSYDSYYFFLNGRNYRVSNHTVESRIGKIIGYDENMQPIREHLPETVTTRQKNVVYIFAGKTRIIDIFNDLKNGHKIDCKGNRIKSKAVKQL